MRNFIPVFSAILFFTSCKQEGRTLFTEMTSTGIDFVNLVEDTDTLNILDYPYYYNGAGVAVGDINNDDLPDIFFASNQGANRLFLNKGNWKFEDITSSVGGLYSGPWTTGVVMADVNNDGYLDIYLSVVGDHEVIRHQQQVHKYFPGASNKLFINIKGRAFADSTAAYGLDLHGYNTQAVFFDADKDGDLDLFQLQHSVHQTAVYGDTSLRHRYSEVSGGKFLLNQKGRFIDNTREAGIISSALGYGLGVAVADFNQDGWDDIYVGNDFHENDYYYLNRHGIFEEQSSRAFGHTSNFSMGNDAADINNDGWMDIITLDMLPADEKVLKSSMGDRPLDTYNNHYAQGYNYQNARNCLQLNTGEGMAFSEIGLFSGVAATDWSWSPLFADYNLDGYTDLFITNGIKRRLNDLDYIKFTSSNAFRTQEGKDYDRQLLEKQPPGEWHNYYFEGTAALKFKDRSKQAGLENASLSNGAAWADLDGDGDLDMVINNLNQPASVLRNNSMDGNKGKKSWLKIRIRDIGENSMGIGTKVFVYAGERLFYQQLQPSRGFLSSVEPVIHLSAGPVDQFDSLVAILPDNRMIKLGKNRMNQLITLDAGKFVQADSNLALQIVGTFSAKRFSETRSDSPAVTGSKSTAFKGPEFSRESSGEFFENITGLTGIDFVHRENDFNDFNRQWFIPHQYSASGPPIAVADVDGDGREDCFFGGSRQQPAGLYIQQSNGRFRRSVQPAIQSDSSSEDVEAIFFDADNDGDHDLFIASGGNELRTGDPFLKDRIYINDGKGNFSKSTAGFPALQSTAAVSTDIDRDGDRDIIVLQGPDAFKYEARPVILLYRNSGQGQFIADSTWIGSLPNGVLTDIASADLDKDGWEDLIVTGEWMEPLVFMNKRGKFNFGTIQPLKGRTGWWQSVSVDDYNGDGHTDLLLGNYGLNSKLSPVDDGAVKLFIADVDNNGMPDQLLSIRREGKDYPFLGKEDLEKQLPYLRKKFLTYESMAGKTMEEIFGDALKGSEILEAKDFRTLLLINDGKGNFSEVEPGEYFQFAPVMDAVAFPYNGETYILAGGNFSGVSPYEGKYDALFPFVSRVNKQGVFGYTLPVEPSLRIPGEVRNLRRIRIGNSDAILVGRNNDTVVVLRFKKHPSALQ